MFVTDMAHRHQVLFALSVSLAVAVVAVTVTVTPRHRRRRSVSDKSPARPRHGPNRATPWIQADSHATAVQQALDQLRQTLSHANFGRLPPILHCE